MANETESYIVKLYDDTKESENMSELKKLHTEEHTDDEILSESLETLPEERYQSRSQILSELQVLGFETEALDGLSIEDLSSLLINIRELLTSKVERKKPGRPRYDPSSVPVLSHSDKIILQRLIESEGHVSSLSISRELGIPLSTIQRRRKRLEDMLVERNYSLKIGLLGWREATLYASLRGGQAEQIGKKILDASNRVTSVSRTLGGAGLDLRIEVIFKLNSELTPLIDQIKSMEGVSGVIWCESLSLIGKRKEAFKNAIE